MRVAVFAVAVAEQRAVAERLPRQFDQQLAVLLIEERQLLVEAVGVEREAVLDQQFDGVGALRAGAPAIADAARCASGSWRWSSSSPRSSCVARQIAGDLVIVAVAFHHMAVIEDGLHRFREALGDRAAGQEGRA